MSPAVANRAILFIDSLITRSRSANFHGYGRQGHLQLSSTSKKIMIVKADNPSTVFWILLQLCLAVSRNPQRKHGHQLSDVVVLRPPNDLLNVL